MTCVGVVFGAELNCEPRTVFENEFSCDVENLADIESASRARMSVPQTVPKENITAITIITKANGPSLDRFPSHLGIAFPNLHSLTIDADIKAINSQDLANSQHLNTLLLSNNNIDTIDDLSFANTRSLYWLELNDNKLTVIKRNTFTGLTRMQELNIRKNRIHTIEDGALEMPKLDILNLSHNRIKSLGDRVFSGLTKIHRILIKNNRLESIGQAFYSLSTIQRIELDENSINDIDLDKFSRLRKLKKLSLRNSGINTQVCNTFLQNLPSKKLDLKC